MATMNMAGKNCTLPSLLKITTASAELRLAKTLMSVPSAPVKQGTWIKQWMAAYQRAASSKASADTEPPLFTGNDSKGMPCVLCTQSTAYCNGKQWTPHTCTPLPRSSTTGSGW